LRAHVAAARECRSHIDLLSSGLLEPQNIIIIGGIRGRQCDALHTWERISLGDLAESQRPAKPSLTRWLI